MKILTFQKFTTKDFASRIDLANFEIIEAFKPPPPPRSSVPVLKSAPAYTDRGEIDEIRNEVHSMI